MNSRIRVLPDSLLYKIKNAPTDAGCYLYKNSANKIIYIGKAKNLRKRVRSYFVAENSKDAKTRSLVRQIADVEYIITNSEIEALILENTLIKKHHPRYNIWFRDDKTYPYVKITNEPYPQVLITRKVFKDGSKYFGPYTDSQLLKETVRIIKNIFSVRSCSHPLRSDAIASRKYKICLDYHIKKCDGPCQNLISELEYNQMISKVSAFLNGKTQEALDYFRRRMEAAASEMRFEDAAQIRDKISTLQNYSNRQVVESNDFIDRDLIAVRKDSELCCAVVFKVRQGKLIGRDSITLEGVEPYDLPEIMRNFIQQFYAVGSTFPQEIVVNVMPLEANIIQSWLSNIRGQKVTITLPQKGFKLHQLKMAEHNADLQIGELLAKATQKTAFAPKSLQNLQQVLNLPALPRLIEAFDISNIRGKYAVGSLITFQDARAKTNAYRRFKIKTVSGSDDYAMLAEVIHRRYSRQLRENQLLPDLILIDGGKGQLHAAQKEMENLKLNHIPIIGLAKRLEEIFRPGSPEPVLLPRDCPALALLQRVRNEAHRFAITYHRKLRSGGAIRTSLDVIEGLGPVKKQALLRHFKTIENIKNAKFAELLLVKGIGPRLAQQIIQSFFKQN